MCGWPDTSIKDSGQWGAMGWHWIEDGGEPRAAFLTVAAACRPRTLRSHGFDARFFVYCVAS